MNIKMNNKKISLWWFIFVALLFWLLFSESKSKIGIEVEVQETSTFATTATSSSFVPFECSEEVFLERLNLHIGRGYIVSASLTPTNIILNEDFVPFDYLAYKWAGENSLKLYRDFDCLDELTFIIPYAGDNYIISTTRATLEDYLGVSIADLRNVDVWESDERYNLFRGVKRPCRFGEKFGTKQVYDASLSGRLVCK